MKTSLLLAPAFAMLLAGRAAPSSAQVAGQPADVNSPAIVTAGEGVVRRAPDRAFVTVTVETRAKAPRDAQAQNAETMTAVQQRLRAVNLAKDAVRTVAYGVEPEWEFANGRRALRDYLARNSIEVRLDDLNRVGEVVDLATAAGATSIGDIRFDLKDRDAAEREALAAAVSDAKGKAEAVATAAGRTIVSIWRITEEGTPQPGPRPIFRAAAMASGPAPVPTPVDAGDIEIRARVSLTAIIK